MLALCFIFSHMILIPIPEGLSMEGRDSGEPFELTVLATMKDGKLSLDSVDGIELAEAEDAEDDFEMDEEAMAAAVAGGVPT